LQRKSFPSASLRKGRLQSFDWAQDKFQARPFLFLERGTPKQYGSRQIISILLIELKLKGSLNLTGFENLSGFCRSNKLSFKLKCPEIKNFYNN
jgi:hypothetical protein